jgi:hypothetical protein
MGAAESGIECWAFDVGGWMFNNGSRRGAAGDRLFRGLFRAQFLERIERGLALGGFLAFARAAGEFQTTVMHRAFKHAIVIRSGGGHHMILGRIRRPGLQHLLQLAFRIFQRRNAAQLVEAAVELAQNKTARRLVTAIEKDRAEDRSRPP